MKINHVLLVYKKSIYQIYFLEKKYRDASSTLFTAKDRERLKSAHERHIQTLETVKSTLSQKKIRFREIYRARQIDYSPFDFVISVGGDGTFLEASKGITSEVILGVNSDPNRSVGNFLPCTRKDFGRYLDVVLDSKAKTLRLNRMALKLDGEPLGFHVVNDILVAHRHPAAMSRYLLKVKEIKEEHRDSGLWVSTAAGSSGAILAAGGKKMPVGSKRLQYLPRELFKPGGITFILNGGFIEPKQPLVIQSRMREGVIYVDGPHLRIPFPFGSLLEITNSPDSLTMVGKMT